MLTIDLQDKIALVLGGSRGIGGAITETFARAGAAVVFTHTDNPKYRERLQAALKELVQDGCQVQAIVADACDPDDTSQLVERVVSDHGRINILVCNVGRNIQRPAEDTTDEEWEQSVSTNLSSSFYGVRAVLPFMLAAGSGKVILIGSSAVLDGGGGSLDYAAAKAGVAGMMRYLTRSYARKGILTNVIHPCIIETDLLRERYPEEKKRALIEQVPAGRLGTPDDIAGLAAFLASSRGDFICGQEFLVDGGRTFFGR